MSSQLTIFVTGASGFLGSHVVLQLLEKGYRVRAAARGGNIEHLKGTYANYGDRFDVVEIADISQSKFPEALNGVDAVIHLASPLAGRETPTVMLEMAAQGTLNVMEQGEKAGVKRFVVTSSIATVKNPQESYTDKDWNPVTKEQALTGENVMLTYSASKKFSELALWDWVDKHSHVEVTTLNPPVLYGPFTAHFPVPRPEASALSTNRRMYSLLFADSGDFPPMTHCIDVRDAALAHIKALDSPPTAQVGRKRIILSSPTGWPLRQTLDFIAQQRPALKERLTTVTPPEFSSDAMPLDFKRIEEVLGMKESDFYTTEETTLDTVDALLKVEDQWRKAGHPIKKL
ncbi:hypothetical protein B0H16DRAFT_1370683 [Mycena metata]|uniref:NAD-dependent epimerase/dehydratase domain-containing protein n=1 Tax=Mycena metata TaxID=1033252 RepID=A0AAD7NFG3_9AGAR|nr:hypothetical protein B0H16DRAFT_1370683 [Mycena metata]